MEMTIESVEVSKLNKLISSLCDWEQNFANNFRSLSGDQNLHDMLNKESFFLVNKKRSILKTLCRYCWIVKSKLKCSLKFRITLDLLMNIDNKLIISYRRLQEMMDFDRLNLFKILTKYDKSEIEENKLDEDDSKIYKEFIKGSGKHRLRFESEREKAVRKFADKIENFSICSDENKLMITTSLKTLTYHDKDRIIDALNTMKNYERCPEVIERAFNFACKYAEKPILQLSDFINHIEFALALYRNEYEKMRYEISFNTHEENGGKRFMKPTKLRVAVHKNRPRNDLWKNVLRNVQAGKEWQKWNRNIAGDEHLILSSPDIKMHNCNIPTMHEPKFCNLLIGFSSISSFLYHFMKHSPPVEPYQFIQMAMRFISSKKVEVQTRFAQNGNGRIITIYSKILEEFIIIAISNDGKANILTYIPHYTKQN